MKIHTKTETFVKCVIEREEIDLIVRLAEAQAAAQFISDVEKEQCKKLIMQLSYENKQLKNTPPKSLKSPSEKYIENMIKSTKPVV